MAAVTLTIGPWSIGLGPLAITGGRFRKPLSLAIVSLTGAMLLSRGMAQAFRSRSVLAFNILATAVCWLMCLGPFGRFGGTLFLERPPYFWLIDLPGFNALRVPTRFAMVGALTLAIAAAVGFARFITPRARLLAAAILAALIADAWPRPIPVVGLPQTYRVPDAAKDAAIVELPPGGSVVGDVVAMARGIAHRRPVVNGYSGHFPPPYEVLRVAFQEGDASVIQALPTTAPVCAVIDRRSNAIDLVPAVEGAGGRHVGADGPFEFYLFEQAPPHASGTPPDPGTRVQVSESARRLDNRLFDGRPDTVWTTRGPQRGRERFAIPLERPRSSVRRGDAARRQNLRLPAEAGDRDVHRRQDLGAGLGRSDGGARLQGGDGQPENVAHDVHVSTASGGDNSAASGGPVPTLLLVDRGAGAARGRIGCGLPV